MSKSKNKGFLLLEVMLAVAILSLGLVMTVRSFASSLRGLRLSRNLLIANLLLEQKIWQRQEQDIRLGGVIPQEEQGEFTLPFDNFSYKISFTEQQDLPYMYQDTAEVFWQQGKTKRGTSAVTYARAKEQ